MIWGATWTPHMASSPQDPKPNDVCKDPFSKGGRTHRGGSLLNLPPSGQIRSPLSLELPGTAHAEAELAMGVERGASGTC